MSRSCDKALQGITQFKLCSTEINKLKTQPPVANGYMIPHYVGEDISKMKTERSDTSQLW